MKRILTGVAIFFIIIFSAIYLLIPKTIHLSVARDLSVNREALFRNLSIDTNWAKWWPGEIRKGTPAVKYFLNGLHYQLMDNKILSLPVLISGKKINAPVEITMLALAPDSLRINISGTISSSGNPAEKIQGFFTARKIKRDLGLLLDSVKSCYTDLKKLYGYDIQKKQVVDSILMMNYREIKGYPSVENTYNLINELKAYISRQGASETGRPMLNVFTEDSINYLLRVAIPVNKKLSPFRNMSYRWMLGGGNILVTEVKGDNKEIQKAYRQIQQYISDFKRVAPAIPFESLVTDRRIEKDSTKWITRIYYPVM